jgi:hypothetical protein
LTLDQPEAATAQTPGLIGAARASGNRTAVSVQGTAGATIFEPEVAATHMQGGVHVEVPLPLPQVAEGDPGGVSEEPGSLVVEGIGTLLQ